jgi:hypothetical protein
LISISRAAGTLTFPANFMLVAAMNPCPCGWYGDPVKPCTCSPALISRYQHRFSGPLLDRIDIHLDVTRMDYEKLSDGRTGEKSDCISKLTSAVTSSGLDCRCTDGVFKRRFSPTCPAILWSYSNYGWSYTDKLEYRQSYSIDF